MRTQDGISFHVDIAEAAHTATVDGAGVATANYDSLTAFYVTGAYTDGTHTPALQDSPDNSTWTNVASTYLDGAFTAVSSTAGQDAVQSVKYLGTQPYVRVAITVSGATTGCVEGAYMVLGDARKLPAPVSL